MSADDFSQALKTKNQRLPTLPGIASMLIEAVHRDEPDIREISDIISKDPPLSAEVLKFVNSPYFGMRKKISSVLHASQMLGINAVKNLALSFSLVNSFTKADKFNYETFWKDSLIAAVSCKRIAQQVAPAFSEDAFFLGLLHDIGVLVLAEYFPTDYRQVVGEMTDADVNSVVLENRILGFDHMVAGHCLAEAWGFPDTLSVPIRYHHQPKQLADASDDIVTKTRVLHLATQFVTFFKQPEDVRRASALQFYADAYGYADKLDIDSCLNEVNQQVADVLPIFDITDFNRETYQALIEQAREALVSVSYDHIQQLIEQEQQIEDLKENISKDSMTSLYNHRAFHQILRQEIQRTARYGKPVSILIADLDNFKQINDSHGHLVGDKVIKLVAEILRSSARETDYIARYGGEEFSIICTETGIDGAFKLAERLRQSIADSRLIHDGVSIQVTVSIGIVSVENGEEITEEELIHRADQALYCAKKRGKNTCCSHL